MHPLSRKPLSLLPWAWIGQSCKMRFAATAALTPKGATLNYSDTKTPHALAVESMSV